MESIEVTLRLLSPAFLAGSNQRQVELRAASIKGLLRWWWRAACADTALDSKELLRREGELFGIAAKSGSMKAPFSCEVTFVGPQYQVIKRGSPAPRSSVTYEWHKDGKQGNADALHYLSYAVIRIPTKDERAQAKTGGDPDLWDQQANQPKKAPVYIRQALAEGTRFTLRLSWLSGRLSPQQKRELFRALAAWIVLGGLGSRSRKGFGSLGLVGPAPQEFAPHLQEMHQRLRNASPADLPPRVPHWPSLAYLQVLGSFSAENWREALGKAASAYREIRPKGESKWIAGSANPRRASSVFVTLTEEDGHICSWIYALPCKKEGKSDAAEDRHTWNDFLRLARAQLASMRI